MKNAVKSILSIFLSLVMILSFAACRKSAEKEKTQESTSAVQTTEQSESGLWKDAVYAQNKEFGEGKTTVKVEVKADDKSVTFTVKTDKEILGDALLDNKLIAGEESEYGLFVKTVNGITADYDKDKAYWAFYKDGEYMNTGVDGAKIADGEHYELVYTK